MDPSATLNAIHLDENEEDYHITLQFQVEGDDTFANVVTFKKGAEVGVVISNLKVLLDGVLRLLGHGDETRPQLTPDPTPQPHPQPTPGD